MIALLPGASVKRRVLYSRTVPLCLEYMSTIKFVSRSALLSVRRVTSALTHLALYRNQGEDADRGSATCWEYGALVHAFEGW